MLTDHDELDAFNAFVAERWRQLLRAGWTLTGSWAGAEDLVQTTLERAWRNWPRVVAADSPTAYVHRILVNEYLGPRRRRRVHETTMAVVPERPVGDEVDEAESRLTLAAALDVLTPPQRAAVSLRFLADLSVEDTAAALGCSVGTVKSHTSRALQKLRLSPLLSDLVPEGPS